MSLRFPKKRATHLHSGITSVGYHLLSGDPLSLPPLIENLHPCAPGLPRHVCVADTYLQLITLTSPSRDVTNIKRRVLPALYFDFLEGYLNTSNF